MCVRLVATPVLGNEALRLKSRPLAMLRSTSNVSGSLVNVSTDGIAERASKEKGSAIPGVVRCGSTLQRATLFHTACAMSSIITGRSRLRIIVSIARAIAKPGPYADIAAARPLALHEQDWAQPSALQTAGTARTSTALAIVITSLTPANDSWVDGSGLTGIRLSVPNSR